MADLPDNYPDRAGEFSEDIEDILHRADASQILSEKQKREDYIARLEQMHRQRDALQGEVDFEQMQEYFEAHTEEELEAFMDSDAGKQYTMEKLAEDGKRAMEGQPGESSDEVYSKTYRERRAREEKKFNEGMDE